MYYILNNSNNLIILIITIIFNLHISCDYNVVLRKTSEILIPTYHYKAWLFDIFT